MRRYPITLISSLVLFFVIGGCSSGENNSEERETLSGALEISQAWARPASEGANSAAYFVIRNGTSVSDTLLGIQADGFGKAEVHESYTTGEGLSGMRPAGKLAVASGDSLILKPGGYHVMMMQATRDYAESDSIGVEILFARSGSKSVRIPVRGF